MSEKRVLELLQRQIATQSERIGILNDGQNSLMEALECTAARVRAAHDVLAFLALYVSGSSPEISRRFEGAFSNWLDARELQGHIPKGCNHFYRELGDDVIKALQRSRELRGESFEGLSPEQLRESFQILQGGKNSVAFPVNDDA